jgi:hypothetical protein
MDCEAQKAQATDKIPNDALYRALEVLRDNKNRIEWQEKEIERLRYKADAFDALLSITKTGHHYGNSPGAEAIYSSTYRTERAIEDLEGLLRKPTYAGAATGHAMNAMDADMVDLPSSFYEGVEAENEAVPKTSEWKLKEEAICIGGYVISYDPEKEKVSLEFEGHGIVFDEEDFSDRLEELYEEEIDDRKRLSEAREHEKAARMAYFHGVDVSTGEDQTVAVQMFRISAEDVQKMQAHMNQRHAEAEAAAMPLTNDEISARLKAMREKVMREKTIGDSDGTDGA